MKWLGKYRVRLQVLPVSVQCVHHELRSKYLTWYWNSSQVQCSITALTGALTSEIGLVTVPTGIRILTPSDTDICLWFHTGGMWCLVFHQSNKILTEDTPYCGCWTLNWLWVDLCGHLVRSTCCPLVNSWPELLPLQVHPLLRSLSYQHVIDFLWGRSSEMLFGTGTEM